MSDRKISYLNKTFDDYKESLINYTKKYYPEIGDTLTDSSIGNWMIDLVSAIGDNLSYYIDKAYNETNIDSAEKKSSVYALARSNGFKIPGPKGAMTELKFTCKLYNSSSVSNSSSTLGMPNYAYAPVIKKGTRVKANNGQIFELSEDIDFTEQFDSNGVSNRTITPVVDSNSNILYYNVSKTAVGIAGVSKIYRMTLSSSQIVPFMEVVIPDTDIMNIESIILKDGLTFQSDPLMDEFMINQEFVNGKDALGKCDTYRFFEVNSLLEQYRWGDDMSEEPRTYQFGYRVNNEEIPIYSISKGAWNPVTQKFITEYTDKGYLKVIFGSGEEVGHDIDISDASDFTRYQITRMTKNNMLGRLPKEDMTMYILYRTGGGQASNVATGTINTISYLDANNKNCPVNESDKSIAATILSSITVTNTIPSVAGKDAPTIDELKAMIKYHNAAQERCVTVKDYEDRVMKMPPRYGCPFRVSAIEENNKIMLYLLMVDYNGNLSDVLPSQMIENMQNYLSQYRTVNDFVEIKSGGIINLSFEIDAYIDKKYDSNEVVKNIIEAVKTYMDINSHKLGEDIYVGDIQRQINDIDGVLNVIDIRVYNEHGNGYSSTAISQQIMDNNDTLGYDKDEIDGKDEVDLEASDYILNSNADQMFEIKYPDNDIRVRVKTR